MTFSNIEVAAKYDSAFDVDRFMQIPCVYMGKLSDITLAGADALYSQGSNLLILKPVEETAMSQPVSSYGMNDLEEA